MEVCEINHWITTKTYRGYSEIKQALAGAAAGGNFVQGFMKPNIYAVLVGYGVLASALVAKSTLNIYRNHDFFRSVKGKIIKYTGDGAYHLLAGAGVCAYLFSIVSGFGKNVSPKVLWGVTSLVAGTNLVANVIKKGESTTRGCGFKSVLLSLICSGMYGIENGLFIMLLLLDVVSDIFSDDMKIDVFYLILSAAICTAVIVTIKKMVADHYEAAHEQAELREDTPLLGVAHDRVHVAENAENEDGSFINDDGVRSCLIFWKPSSEQEVDPIDRSSVELAQEEHARASCFLVKSLTSCWNRFRSDRPLLVEEHYLEERSSMALN